MNRYNNKITRRINTWLRKSFIAPAKRKNLKIKMYPFSAIIVQVGLFCMTLG